MATPAALADPRPDRSRPETDEHGPGEHEPAGVRRLNPYLLGYLMGPAALVTILILERFAMVARHPLWLWLAVFTAIPTMSVILEVWFRRRPSAVRLHARVAWHAATVTAVIYLSGWGPVLIGAFAFVALENISHDGSRTWRVTALWSLRRHRDRAGRDLAGLGSLVP